MINRQKIWTEAEHAELVRMCARRMTYDEIGAKLGRSTDGVKRRAQKHNVINPLYAGRVKSKVVCKEPVKIHPDAFKSFGEPCRLINHKSGHCRWPLFDSDLVCNKSCTGSYCTEHKVLSKGNRPIDNQVFVS